MVVLATMLVALAVLFSLTAFAFGAEGRLRHPYPIAAVIAAVLVVGVAVLVAE